MVNHEIHGRWSEISERVFHRGLIGDFLNNPGAVISQVLSPPAETTQEPAKVEATQAPATTQAAAAPVTTRAAATAPATTQQQAQQPVATPAASSPKQEQQQPPPQTPTPVAQAPTTTSKQQAQQPQPTTPAAAASNPAVINSSSPEAGGITSSTANVAGAPTSPMNAVSYHVASQSVVPQSSGASGVGGAATTKSGVISTATQSPPAENYEGQTSGTTNSGPLIATGVVLGIVVLMGISLLLFWCYRRRRKANMHHHEALAPESPVNDYDSESRFRDTIEQNIPSMTQNRAVSGQDHLTIRHALPNQGPDNAPDVQSRPNHLSNPYSGQPFTYAQAQQYAQSYGAFSYPVPPIPEPSPIRIFRWPTRSSRSGSSVFSGFRNSKGPSRAMSRASRSTVSSMLWHGRRDVIARRTMNQDHVAQRNGFLTANGTDSPMPDGLHTPILDWLHWIRGHQSDGGDPEMNHRKSFASTTESSTSEGSIPSSGVFSPTLLSWPPPASDAPPVLDAEALAFLPVPPSLKRQSSNAETVVGPSVSRIQSFS